MRRKMKKLMLVLVMTDMTCVLTLMKTDYIFYCMVHIGSVT